jgi:ELWxxDGT repeat protein
LHHFFTVPGETDLISSITQVGNTVFFAADDGVHGDELWKSDGTQAGTMLVSDIAPGAAGSSPADLVNVNGTLFFTANDGIHGSELWKSNGSTSGTALVKDIYSGAGSSFPTDLTNVGGILYFAAYDPLYGTELWRSQGSAGSTWREQDIYAGAGSSIPSELTNVAGTLFFIAANPRTGTGLWELLPQTLVSPTAIPGDIDSPRNFGQPAVGEIVRPSASNLLTPPYLVLSRLPKEKTTSAAPTSQTSAIASRLATLDWFWSLQKDAKTL